jgi:hypothetical protein
MGDPSMGKCSVEYRELRFIIEPELLQVYVAMDAVGDCPLGIQGWHHKTFPASVNAQEVMQLWHDGKEDPVMWSQDAPP